MLIVNNAHSSSGAGALQALQASIRAIWRADGPKHWIFHPARRFPEGTAQAKVLLCVFQWLQGANEALPNLFPMEYRFSSPVFPPLPLGVAPQLSQLAGRVFLFTYLHPSSCFASRVEFPIPSPWNSSSFHLCSLSGMLWAPWFGESIQFLTLWTRDDLSWCETPALTLQIQARAPKSPIYVVLPHGFPGIWRAPELSQPQHQLCLILLTRSWFSARCCNH